VPLGSRLTLQLASANPQSSHPEHYNHDVELPHLEPAHDDHHDHDHQPSKLMKKTNEENSFLIQESAKALIPIDTR
jgi:hypothetical protein